jgi:hypothetical protein
MAVTGLRCPCIPSGVDRIVHTTQARYVKPVETLSFDIPTLPDALRLRYPESEISGSISCS